MDKKQRKMEIWMGRQKENKEKHTIGRREGFERQTCLGNQGGKTTKTGGNNLLGFFSQKKKHREKMKTPKNKSQKHLLAC